MGRREQTIGYKGRIRGTQESFLFIARLNTPYARTAGQSLALSKVTLKKFPIDFGSPSTI